MHLTKRVHERTTKRVLILVLSRTLPIHLTLKSLSNYFFSAQMRKNFGTQNNRVEKLNQHKPRKPHLT